MSEGRGWTAAGGWRVAVVVLPAAVCCLLATWVGQSFLAHNRLNDADSSYYLYGGWIINQGLSLYKDFWDQKPPGVFLQDALLMRAFGTDFRAFAVAHGLVVLLSCLLVFLALRRLAGTGLAALAAALYAHGFNLSQYQDLGNRTEFLMSTFDLWGVLAALGFLRRERKAWLALAGALSAAAFWFKPTGMAGFLAVLAWLLLRAAFERRPALLAGAAVLVAGFLAVLGPVAAWFAWQGAFGLLLDATILAPMSFGGEGPSLGQAVAALVPRYGPLLGLVLPLAFVPRMLITAVAGPEGRRVLLLLALFLGATLAGIVAQRHGRWHYYLQGVGPLVLCSAYALHLLRERYAHWAPRLLIPLVFLAAMAWYGRWPAERHLQRFLDLDRMEAAWAHYDALGAWLRERLRPGEGIYYWSHGYQPYVLTGTRSPGRVSPYLLAHGPAGAAMVAEDLVRVRGSGVRWLVENAAVMPGLFDTGELLCPEARRCLEAYQTWRDAAFERVPCPVEPFRIWRRRAPAGGDLPLAARPCERRAHALPECAGPS